jgi:hypothetical protein
VGRVADIVLIASQEGDPVVEDLAFWMGTEEACDPGKEQYVSGVPASSVLEVGAPRGLIRVGNLMPLTSALGEELWGGYKSLKFSAWGGVTNNMDWDRFLGRVASASWANPEHVQLLLKDDGDRHFRLYIVPGGGAAQRRTGAWRGAGTTALVGAASQSRCWFGPA